MGSAQRRQNRDRGEAIGLDQDLVPGGGDLADDEIGAIAAGVKQTCKGACSAASAAAGTVETSRENSRA